ncbi:MULTISPECIES: hypothetical protein [unclassified Pseudomonas]|uniref:hypothetical protein n=1 Tax=unclassified Pseudomonas TaxID=196821 RepID=UPI000730E314|nr:MULTISPECIES: hypothetical protein [unclassified Pseudomonas]KSW22640.1 hypothetical protein AOX63_04230 [Pseudomonas sp. ADP]OBP11384.1 hypothetical protein BAE52_09745 [Pseudomonas sp. EGD-AKN5]QOF85457.1 hypothetical protein IG194_01675 [Pseudomonas sp. ADPe]
MTDLTKLKELSERYIANPSGTGGEDSAFRAAANPQAILGLIAQIEGLERLINGRWREIEEDRDRLKAENEALRKAFDEANEMLARIGDFAHDKSAGPAVPDALWEIRSMAYSAVRIGFDIALEGGGK